MVVVVPSEINVIIGSEVIVNDNVLREVCVFVVVVHAVVRDVSVAAMEVVEVMVEVEI